MTEASTDPTAQLYDRVTVRVDRPGRRPVVTTFNRVEGFRMRTDPSWAERLAEYPKHRLTAWLDFTITGRAGPDGTEVVKSAEVLDDPPLAGFRLTAQQVRDWPDHADDLACDLRLAHERIRAALSTLDGSSFRLADRVRAALTGTEPPD